MEGRWLGTSGRTVGLQKLADLFDANFKNADARYNGIALGIAGDTNPNVLWRLMHGEMPTSFHPKIWWLSLGMNDLARMKVRV